MDGIHDLGGMSGFGGVEVERDEPVFHETWESLAFALNLLGIACDRARTTSMSIATRSSGWIRPTTCWPATTSAC